MGRTRTWDQDKVEEEIIPRIQSGESIAKIAKSYGISRQRLYKILKESGYDSNGVNIDNEGGEEGEY